MIAFSVDEWDKVLDWDSLLAYIEDGEVIPIVGPELVTATADGHEIPLYRYVAERLAKELRVPVADLPGGWSLNDLVDWFEHSDRHKEDIYAPIRKLLKTSAFPPSPSLLDLARIRPFDLFVSYNKGTSPATPRCEPVWMSVAVDTIRASCRSSAPSAPWRAA